MTIEQRAAMTDEELTDMIAEAIDESMDVDWTSRDGARHVLGALKIANVLSVWQPIESAEGAAVEVPLDAVAQLTERQRQLDPDGTFVGVSRQALDEVLTFLAVITTPPEN